MENGRMQNLSKKDLNELFEELKEEFDEVAKLSDKELFELIFYNYMNFELNLN